MGLSLSSAFRQENLLPSLFKPLARLIALWVLHRGLYFFAAFWQEQPRNSWRLLTWLHVWGLTLIYQGFYTLV